MLRLGIIGTGNIAYTNLSALQSLQRAQVVALCNRTAEKAAEFASSFGLAVPVYTDYRRMLEKESLDAVLICTPHTQHCQQFCDCAAAGLAIMIEKPLCTSIEEAELMLSAEQEYNIPAAVCQTQRYLAPIRAAKAYIDSHAAELGRLRHITDRINLYYFHDKRAKWFFDPALSGGGLSMTHGSHQIDRIHYFCGNPTSRITGNFEELPLYPGLDSAYQILGMAGDVSYCASCSGYPTPHASNMQLDFEQGSIRIFLYANGLDQEGFAIGNADGWQFQAVPNTADEAYRLQFSAMLDHFDGLPAPFVSISESAAVIRALELARKQ